MEFLKRKRARAIVVNDSKLVSMYREFDDRSFYVFPGVGEEFDVNSNKEGVYIPKLIDISSIPNLPLMPKEVASSFYEDYTNNCISLRQDVKHVIV